MAVKNRLAAVNGCKFCPCCERRLLVERFTEYRPGTLQKLCKSCVAFVKKLPAETAEGRLCTRCLARKPQDQFTSALSPSTCSGCKSNSWSARTTVARNLTDLKAERKMTASSKVIPMIQPNKQPAETPAQPKTVSSAARERDNALMWAINEAKKYKQAAQDWEHALLRKGAELDTLREDLKQSKVIRSEEYERLLKEIALLQNVLSEEQEAHAYTKVALGETTKRAEEAEKTRDELKKQIVSLEQNLQEVSSAFEPEEEAELALLGYPGFRAA